MSDTDITADLQAQIEAKLDSEEANAESEVDSDTDAEEVEANAETESAQMEEKETSEEEAEESKDESATESEVEFDFHDTSTSLQQLVSNLKNLPPEERKERISKLTRVKEIEAAKQEFPNDLAENTTVTRQELDALNAKLEELTRLAKPEELEKALAIAAKLQATEGLTDTRLKDLMLQEQFGDSSKEVSNDPKFITAYEKFPTLPIEERLEYACSLSAVARKLATDDEVKKQVRLQGTKTVNKGKQEATQTTLEAKDVKSLSDFEKLLEAKFND